MMKFSSIKDSNIFRVLFIGFLILLLLIPMGMVESVISERSHIYRQATDEITHSWGNEQLIVGPVLTLPYVKTVNNNTGWSYGWSYDSRYEHLRPQSMAINSNVETEIRYRSIYKVPVYTATVRFTGHFSLLDSSIVEEDENGIGLDEGVIQIPIPVDRSRSIKEPVRFFWDGEEIALTPKLDDSGSRYQEEEEVDIIALTPKLGDSGSKTVIFTGKLPKHLLSKDKVHEFEYDLKLVGSKEVAFLSSAQKTTITLDSNWASPGFFGLYLPTSREITDDGFSATWEVEVNDLFKDLAYVETELVSSSWFLSQPGFGVKLIQPVDTYQTVTRAAKYAVLFISLTFMVYFFTELFGKVLLHPIQYLFVGVANCIFYLLLLSLAEHINFVLAYFISASASIVLISLYSQSILKSRAKALIVFITLSGLYTYLFVTLRSEGFALLIGSIGLFVILGFVMYLTRNIDWRKVGPETADH